MSRSRVEPLSPSTLQTLSASTRRSAARLSYPDQHHLLPHSALRQTKGPCRIIPPAGVSVKYTTILPKRCTRVNRRFSLTPSLLVSFCRMPLTTRPTLRSRTKWKPSSTASGLPFILRNNSLIRSINCILMLRLSHLARRPATSLCRPSTRCSCAFVWPGSAHKWPRYGWGTLLCPPSSAITLSKSHRLVQLPKPTWSSSIAAFTGCSANAPKPSPMKKRSKTTTRRLSYAR